MKRYLHTPEEVMQALKEGKTVETDMKYYVLKDGLPNCYAKNKTGRWWTVNSAIYDSDRPYVDEPEPLKLEVGKFYKTRDGRKAWVVAYKQSYQYPYYVAVIGQVGTYAVLENGYFGFDKPSPEDIVAPWEE